MNLISAIHAQAQARPHSPAYMGRRTVTYSDLMREVGRAAGALRHAGVKAGDVVAIIEAAPFWHITLTLAVAQLAAASVPLASTAAAGINEEAAERCGVDYVIGGDPGIAQRVPRVRAHFEGAAALFAESTETVSEIVQAGPRDIWRIGFSSGTTGKAKAIRFDHQGSIARCELMRDYFVVAPGDRVSVLMPMTLPFSTSYWLRTLMYGGTLVNFSAALDGIRRFKVNILVTSTGNAMTMVRTARRAGGASSPPAESLKALFIGGASATPAFQELLRRHICPNLNINYGASEVGIVALADTQLQLADPSCAGRIVPWMEVQAVDANDQPLGHGIAGRLRLRGPTLAAGYVPGSEDPADVPAFRDGWYYTNDTGVVSADGLVHLSGREDDVINLGGAKFPPSRIEKVIAKDPAVIECAVVLLHDRLGLPVLGAAVEASGNFDAQAARQRCRAALGENMTPRDIVQMDSLPRNAAGKVQRDELTAQLLQRLLLQHPAPTGVQ
ncbi:class I adenylate-forming enzyme family protein [Ramlibacter sp. WS9]|uniref:class I adenylate-forming enzyme family protein n=1 Tax=Ramlibacter sp. WS9 TaxID=1882741 RepID=UPI00114318B5|nr:class I adenylate-forming enzyme family protein [Ramlibacter sp. WS9]ROZ72141.1 long-chain fatty acid--CoA ligase [Ramlibacter sp. WS9]